MRIHLQCSTASARPIVIGAAVASVLWCTSASADISGSRAAPAVASAGTSDPAPANAGVQLSSDTTPRSGADESAGDPTRMSAYTSPTLLFIPAGAVPKWNVRIIASTEVQSPSDVHAGFRPGLGGELGLPGGFTIGAGTNWVGGDISPSTGNTDFNLGLSPYVQARVHILGNADGQGFQLGTGVTYKFVGFEGDPGEMELAMSAQYRRLRYEVGLQGVVGQDFGDSRNHDGEIHAYAVYKVIPRLALGAAGQVRIAIAPPADATDSHYDVIGGAIASLTLGAYQIAALGGASTLGLDQGHAGALGQVFGSFRF